MNFDDVSTFFQRVAKGQLFREDDSFAEYLTKTKRYGSEADVIKNFDHLVEDVRGWMRAKKYHLTEELMNFMLEKKAGKFRNDGVTPSALHELTQAVWFISCIEDGVRAEMPQSVLGLIFVHDVGEDFGVRPEELRAHLKGKGFGKLVVIDDLLEDFDAISKRYGDDGPPRYANEYEYFHLALCKRRHASIAKLIDRAHNIMTLVGVKEAEGEAEKVKMMKKIAETKVLINDMCRDSARNFPEQEEFYENIKSVINAVAQTSRYFVVNTGKKMVDDEDLYISMPERGFFNLPDGFHPLIFAAERVRRSYPETHLDGTQNLRRRTNLDVAKERASSGEKTGGKSGSANADGDFPEVTQ